MPGSAMVTSRYALVGDGFFGALGGLFKKIARPVASLIPGVGTALSVVDIAGRAGIPPKAFLGPIAGPLIAPGLTRQALARGGPSGLAARTGGQVARIPSLSVSRDIERRTIPGVLAAPGRRRFRRMNVLNPKALKRATRRLAGFHHFAVTTESELRKLAPRPRGLVGRKPKCR